MIVYADSYARGNVRHEIRMYWIAAVGMFRVIEVDYIKGGLNLAVPFRMIFKMIICNRR